MAKATRPEGIPDWMCGARKKKAEGHCQRRKLEGRNKCALHGGRTPLAHCHTAAVKHGIYSQTLTQEEVAEMLNTHPGSVDFELQLARVRLQRALKAEARDEAKEDEVERLKLEELAAETAVVNGIPVPKAPPLIKKKFKKSNYNDIVDKLLYRIESLERTRAELARAEAAAVAGALAPVGEVVVRIQSGDRDADFDA